MRPMQIYEKYGLEFFDGSDKKREKLSSVVQYRASCAGEDDSDGDGDVELKICVGR